MCAPRKKLIAYCLLLLWSVPLITLTAFELKQVSIKELMREALSTEKLTELTLIEKDVVWIDDHEIWINNKMFDIKSARSENGKLIISGLYDESETELVNNRNKDGKSEKSLLADLSKWTDKHFCSSGCEVSYSAAQINRDYKVTHTPKLLSLHLNILTPPPKC